MSSAGGRPLVYRIEYAQPGKAVRTTFQAEMPLEIGQWITVDGVYLTVERIVRGKRGDPFDGLALCKPAVG